MEFLASMTEADERPLLEFVRSTGGRLFHLFSPVWPPVCIESPRKCGEDECLGIWHPEIISEAEFLLPESRPEKEVYHDAWRHPLIRFQRQWYWKKGASIFSVAADSRSFRPHRPEDDFTPAEVGEFEQRLGLLHQQFDGLRNWLSARLRVLGPNCFAGDGALRESAELCRSYEDRLNKRFT